MSPAVGRGNPDDTTGTSSIEPHAVQIAFGLAFVAVSGWLIFSALPAHKPMSLVGIGMYVADGIRNLEDRTDHWMIREELYPWLFVLAGFIGIAGMVQVIRGATFRQFRMTRCRLCRKTVRAEQTLARGSRCPNGWHSTTSTPMTYVLIALFCIAFSILATSYFLETAT